MGDWIPARTTPHPAAQSIAVGAVYNFPKPTGANGFLIGADGPFTMTFDGTTATATNGLLCDPGKGGQGMVAVSVITQLSVFNKHTSAINVSVAWLENTEH